MIYQNFILALITVFFFIFLGYFLRKKDIINDNCKKFLSFMLMNITLPALALKSFICDFSVDDLSDDIAIIIISFILYGVLLLLGNLVFIKNKNKKIYSIFCALGQITLFSLPIIECIYPTNEALITISLVTIGFRFFLYIYSFIIFSNDNHSKKTMFKSLFLNPIIISMLLGIFIWLSQNFMFKVIIDTEQISILRIDKTVPILYSFISTLASLTIPFSMLLIGSTIGERNIKEAWLDKTSITISFIKCVGAPVICLIILLLINMLPFVSLSNIQIASIVIGFAAPLSAVVNTYAIKYNKESMVACNTCLISTVMCIFTFPILILLLSL